MESGGRARRGAVAASPRPGAGTNKESLQQDPAREDSELPPQRSPRSERGGKSLAAGGGGHRPQSGPAGLYIGAFLWGLQTTRPPPQAF